MRVAVIVFCAQPHAVHDLRGLLAALGRAQAGIHQQGFFQRGANALTRVQGAIRILKNNLNFGAQARQG